VIGDKCHNRRSGLYGIDIGSEVNCKPLLTFIVLDHKQVFLIKSKELLNDSTMARPEKNLCGLSLAIVMAFTDER
jgi:hypothetical protein